MWTCNRNAVKQVQKRLQEVEYTFLELYSLYFPGFFKIDQLRGVIKTAISLQGHSRGAPYDVIVEAIDNGVPTRLRSIATVHITIQDPQAFIGRPTFVHPTPGMIKSIPEVCS
jgi:hypothetical protein